MENDLKNWMNRISEQEISVFKRKVNAVKATRDDDTSASVLAQVVLQDSAPTVRVLKIAQGETYSGQ